MQLKGDFSQSRFLWEGQILAGGGSLLHPCTENRCTYFLLVRNRNKSLTTALPTIVDFITTITITRGPFILEEICAGFLASRTSELQVYQAGHCMLYEGSSNVACMPTRLRSRPTLYISSSEPAAGIPEVTIEAWKQNRLTTLVLFRNEAHLTFGIGSEAPGTSVPPHLTQQQTLHAFSPSMVVVVVEQACGSFFAASLSLGSRSRHRLHDNGGLEALCRLVRVPNTKKPLKVRSLHALLNLSTERR